MMHVRFMARDLFGTRITHTSWSHQVPKAVRASGSVPTLESPDGFTGTSVCCPLLLAFVYFVHISENRSRYSCTLA